MKNPPSTSNFLGVFERQIRTIREVLIGLLLKQDSRISDKYLSFLLYEVAAVISCRLLSHINLSDASIKPTTPNHLLTQKSRVVAS